MRLPAKVWLFEKRTHPSDVEVGLLGSLEAFLQ